MNRLRRTGGSQEAQWSHMPGLPTPIRDGRWLELRTVGMQLDEVIDEHPAEGPPAPWAGDPAVLLDHERGVARAEPAAADPPTRSRSMDRLSRVDRRGHRTDLGRDHLRELHLAGLAAQAPAILAKDVAALGAVDRIGSVTHPIPPWVQPHHFATEFSSVGSSAVRSRSRPTRRRFREGELLIPHTASRESVPAGYRPRSGPGCSWIFGLVANRPNHLRCRPSVGPRSDSLTRDPSIHEGSRGFRSSLVVMRSGVRVPAPTLKQSGHVRARRRASIRRLQMRWVRAASGAKTSKAL